ncbi:ROK family protein [Mesobacillus foraminis]|uniref:ROK family protein n=1 Tax=Mesobacillus foraminis TaxID=279826 RepID=UPI001BE73284|nr:ROK family protein [Mesobacillus foraminis]MBT2759244.1 ROK family protein [Mesobacillus foraminis]
MLIGGIEAGGTKFICGIGNEKGEILESISFPTEAPDLTLEKCIAFFKDKAVESIGVGTFGPINLERDSSHYGFITTTPKEGWANFDFLGTLKKEFQIPLGWDTDVNAAALAESRWGAAKGLSSCIYFTIGTGIGMGALIEGNLIHGLVHPEAGHLSVRSHEKDDFRGICPFHGDCLEGMASGPAIEKRWNLKGYDIPKNHPAWDLEAYYISRAVTGAILMLSPKKIILGGGVMNQHHLFPMIRKQVQQELNQYINAEDIIFGIDDYIVPPGLGSRAGLCGAMALGMDAIKNHMAFTE